MGDLLVFRDNWDRGAPGWLDEKRREAETYLAKAEETKERMTSERAAAQHGYFDSRGTWKPSDAGVTVRSWSAPGLKMSGVFDTLGMPVGIWTDPKANGGTLTLCVKRAVAEMLRQQAAAVELSVKRTVIMKPGAKEPEKPKPWPKSTLAVAVGYEREAVQDPTSEELQANFDDILARAKKNGPGSLDQLAVEKRLTGDATALWTMRCPKGFVHVRVDRMLLVAEVIVPWLDSTGCERLKWVLREGGGMAYSMGNDGFERAVWAKEVVQLSDVPALTGAASNARSYQEVTARAPYQFWPDDTDPVQRENNHARKEWLKEHVKWGWA